MSALISRKGVPRLRRTFMCGIVSWLICIVLPMLSQGKSAEEQLRPFPRVCAWMQRVAEVSSPHHAEISRGVFRVADRLRQRKDSKKQQMQSKL
jgi:hypothetical protein